MKIVEIKKTSTSRLSLSAITSLPISTLVRCYHFHTYKSYGIVTNNYKVLTLDSAPSIISNPDFTFEALEMGEQIIMEQN